MYKRVDSLLNQADPAVEVELKESGELVLIAAGEVHIDRCLTDLRESYCPGVGITVSKPILPFRETIVPFSGVDMRNEAINDENVQSARQVYLLGTCAIKTNWADAIMRVVCFFFFCFFFVFVFCFFNNFGGLLVQVRHRQRLREGWPLCRLPTSTGRCVYVLRRCRSLSLTFSMRMRRFCAIFRHLV